MQRLDSHGTLQSESSSCASLWQQAAGKQFADNYLYETRFAGINGLI